jgi:gas vesicle structural protein
MSMLPSAAPAPQQPLGGQISDVVGLILDKGLVIDVYARVSLVGIEVLTVDARVVVASVDTYLRFAEAAGRLDLEATRKPGLPELLHGLTGGGSQAPAALEPAEDPGDIEPASLARLQGMAHWRRKEKAR